MLDSNGIAEAARILVAARTHGFRPEALPPDCQPTTLDEAHAIQDATATLLAESIKGWKVGAAPDGRVTRGALLHSRLLQSGAVLAARDVPMLGVEAEIAFRFDRDLPRSANEYSYADVAAAVTAFPAIEVVDSRFANYPHSPFYDRIADCMSNGAFVQGIAHEGWRDIDLADIAVTLTIDGQTVIRRNGGHPTKDPLLPAVALANDLRHLGGIAAGQMVTTGTYTGLNFAKPGETVRVAFDGFRAVEVRFDAL